MPPGHSLPTSEYLLNSRSTKSPLPQMATDDVNETSRLLPSSPHIVADDQTAFNIWDDLIGLTKQSISICLSFALQNAVQAISVLTAGSLGSFELAVTSYGFMFLSCTGTMVAIGGATALDTLCAHASASHAVRENPKILGLLLQQCMLVLLGIFVVVIAPIWVFSGQIFVALGHEQDFAFPTGRFMLFMLPAGVLQVVAECLKKFLQVQGASNMVGMSTAAASAVGVFINWVLVRWTSLKLWGVPVAFGIYLLLTVTLLLYIAYDMPSIRKTLRLTLTGTLSGLPKLLFYAVTGILTIATEWWSFEILAMMAARLDQYSIGAQSILMSSDLLFTTVSLGIGVAASHRIGNLLGANKVSLAKKSIATPFLLSLIIGAFEFVGIILVRNQYGRLFTADRAVIRRTAEVLPLMAGFQVLDLSNGGVGGILRGAGKNHLSGACNFLAYYGIGLTSAWFLCFQKDYGLFGLWAGIITGSASLLVLQTCCVLTIPWKKLGKDISGIQSV